MLQFFPPFARGSALQSPQLTAYPISPDVRCRRDINIFLGELTVSPSPSVIACVDKLTLDFPTVIPSYTFLRFRPFVPSYHLITLQLVLLLLLLLLPLNSSPRSRHPPRPKTKTTNYQLLAKMCDVITYYYVYRNCRRPEFHAHSTSRGRGTMKPCSNSPHQEFRYEPGECSLCSIEGL
jgi:hypothetical protein